MSKTTGKFKSTVEWLSKPSNAITVGVLVIVAIVVVVFITRKVKAAIQSAKEKLEEPDPANTTPGLNFSELARRLWDATVNYHSLGSASILLGNMPTGTDEDEVYAVLGALRTQDDYIALKKSWRNYYDSVSGFVTWITSAVSTLPGMLHDEMTSRELQRCRNILENNNITPDF